MSYLSFFYFTLHNDVWNRQIQSLPDSLKGAYQEIEDATNFHVFTLLGGPSMEGSSAFLVMRVQTGRTVSD